MSTSKKIGRGNNPNSRANLRPVSRDPALASAMGKKYGFGNLRTCEKCGKPAAFNTPVCVSHGARMYKGTPPSPWRELTLAREVLSSADISPELDRNEAWRALDTAKPSVALPARVALLKAWNAMQEGNPGPWREMTKILTS